MAHLGHLIGTVQTVGTNQFTLLSGEGRTFTIGVNSGTTYEFPSSVCSTTISPALPRSKLSKSK